MIIITAALMSSSEQEPPPRSKIALAVGFLAHLFVLAFTMVVVWTAKPSSSKLVKQPYTLFSVSL